MSYGYVSNHLSSLVHILVLAQLAFLGHRLGDFMFQNKSMAIRKSKYSHPGWQGFWYCTCHVFIYSICICACVWTYSPLIFAAVFIPHWLIDRYSLGEFWLILVRGRTYLSTAPSDAVGNAFYALVYQKVDETLHYLCLALVIVFFNRFI